ncbi:DinB family protein, partial [Gemmatimonadota bacterium]
DGDLAALRSTPNASAEYPLRWWLWSVLEHEIHHKAQLAIYLRQMGKVAPYFADPLPLGERPDIQLRDELGGV